MEKVRLGKSGLLVTRPGFGGIPIQRLPEGDAVNVVRRCLDLGINFIDTANGYSDSEVKIGKAIAGRRDGLILATKSAARDADGIRSHLELSLSNLRVESIDLYQFHNVSDSDTYDKVASSLIDVLEEEKRKGRIKHIGITSHNLEVAKRAVISGRFETLMFALNFIASEAADELLPLCRQNDVGFIAMKPMAGGMLDNATIAFKYVLQFPDVVPIVGIQHLHEIDEMMRVVNGPRELTEAERAEMKRIRDLLGSRFCHSCDYCQPCAQGVPISMVMKVPSFLRRLSPKQFFAGRIGHEVEKASLCIRCGECEPRCPYNLPIMDLLEEYHSLYQQEKGRYLADTDA